MDIQITHVRMSTGGTHHSHILRLKGFDPQTRQAYDATRAEWVDYVEKGGRAHTHDSRGNVAYLRVRQTANGVKYVQTYADGIYSDNLLALPRY